MDLAAPPRETRPRAFPVIEHATFGWSSRGLILTLILADIGPIEVTARELSTARRFARAVFRQTGHEFNPLPQKVWRRWLADCVRASRNYGGSHAARSH